MFEIIKDCCANIFIYIDLLKYIVTIIITTKLMAQ